MKYALLIYKFQPSVSFHCHLFMDLQYCPSILSVNMPQLQKTGKITLPPSCRLDTKTQNLQADCGKKKYKRNDVWYRQIWNHPECTAPMAGLIVYVSHFFPNPFFFFFIACAKSHLLLVRLSAATPKRRNCDTMLNNNQALSLNLHQKSLIHSDRENTWWPRILFPSPPIPS